MRKIRVGAAAISLLLSLAFVASAQAVPNFTTSNVTSPADGTLLFQNAVTSPSQTFTVSGTTNGIAGDLLDLACFNGNSETYEYGGPSNAGIALPSAPDFSVTVPESNFGGGSCHLLVVPHGTTSPGTTYTGPRVAFSEFSTVPPISSGPNAGTLYDYYLGDATMAASSGSDSIGDCGPYSYLVDGTSAMNSGPYLIYCGGSLYGSPSDFFQSSNDLGRSDIEIDGQNAYGSASAYNLFTGSDALPGFPALSASLDSFDSSNANAQTTESEPLVKCTPNDVYTPTSSDCTAFASTGVAIKRVTSYSDTGLVETVTDTFSSTDGQAHSLDLEYETDLGGTASGWEFPGQTSFTTPSTGTTGAAPSTAPDTVYVIGNIAAATSVSNPVGAMTFATPYNSVKFDNTLWGGENSGLFDYQRMVPAAGSTSITWSYATSTSLAAVQGYAAAAQAELKPVVAITSPASGATVTKSPLTVTGTAGGGSGVKSVTVNGVTATVSGGTWSATVPLNLGHNTLAAAMTTDDSSTATASVTVNYAPPPRVSVKSKRFNGKAVLVKLACAASGSNCHGKLTLRYTETVVRHHKKHKVAVVIASKSYSIGRGHTATVKAALNGTGKRLLKARGKLATRGTVTVTQANGHATTGASFRLTLK